MDQRNHRSAGKPRRRKESRQQEILDAAYVVFARKGFAAARMDDIANEAGISKGTLYLYFDGKEEVFKELVVGTFRGQADILSRAARRSDDRSSAHLLRDSLRLLGQFVLASDRVELTKIVIGESGRFPEIARFYFEEVIGRGTKVWEAILREAVARREFRDVPIRHAVRLCMSPIVLAAIWRSSFAQVDPEPFNIEGLIESHIDLLLNGLLYQPAKGNTAQ